MKLKIKQGMTSCVFTDKHCSLSRLSQLRLSWTMKHCLIIWQEKAVCACEFNQRVWMFLNNKETIFTQSIKYCASVCERGTFLKADCHWVNWALVGELSYLCYIQIAEESCCLPWTLQWQLPPPLPLLLRLCPETHTHTHTNIRKELTHIATQ